MKTIEQLKTFISNLPSSVAMFDENICYIACSERWIEDYSLKGKEIIGKSHYDIFPNIPKRWKEIHQKALNGHALKSDGDSFIGTTGMKEWLKWDIRPWSKSNGEIGGIIMLSEVITKQKRVEEKLEKVNQRLELALEGANIGIWQWDVQKNELIWDEKMHDLYGIAKEEGRNNYEMWASALHPEDRKEAELQIKIALEGKKDFDTLFRVIKSSGEVSHIMGRAKLVYCDDGSVSSMIGINWDITEIKKKEKALEEARNQADLAVKAKAQFLSNMSHEIRTPLNGIMGYCELLSEDNTIHSGVKDKIRTIFNASYSLLQIINDILDYSKIESGMISLHYERLEIYDELCDLKQLFQVCLKDEVSLLFDLKELKGKCFNVDILRIKQVLTNLIGNAIKFTNNGKITVTGQYDSNKEQLKFIVEDTGCGIPKNKVDEIFETFVQADSSITKRFGGSGLGLSICKSLVELMSGRITCESKEGYGSRFEFYIHSIEIKDFTNKVSGPNQKKEYDYGLKVLVVEDIEINQNLARDMLEKMGCEVELASSGFESIDKVLVNKFDLILMDVNMPGMSGYEATKKIRAMDIRQPKIYALTANAFEEDKRSSLDSGMNGHLSKPFRKQQLEQILAQISSTAA